MPRLGLEPTSPGLQSVVITTTPPGLTMLATQQVSKYRVITVDDPGTQLFLHLSTHICLEIHLDSRTKEKHKCVEQLQLPERVHVANAFEKYRGFRQFDSRFYFGRSSIQSVNDIFSPDISCRWSFSHLSLMRDVGRGQPEQLFIELNLCTLTYTDRANILRL